MMDDDDDDVSGSHNEDDADSISTTSTVESEKEAEYQVEEIFAEGEDEDGETGYLIKWEGYPLHRCTFEPVDHVKDLEMFDEWEAHKQNIVEGRIKSIASFEDHITSRLEEYYAAVDEEEAAKQERHQRREAKRKRKQRLRDGQRTRRAFITQSPDSDDENDLPIVPPSGNSRRRITRRSSTEMDDDDDDRDDANESPNRLFIKDTTMARPEEDLDDSLFHDLVAKSSDLDSNSTTRQQQSDNQAHNSKRQGSSAQPTSPKISKILEKREGFTGPSSKVRAVYRASAKAVAAKSSAPSIPRTDMAAIPRIKITNGPVPVKRRAWGVVQSDRQYNKLKYRGIAQKRARTEHINLEDLASLDFINDPSRPGPKIIRNDIPAAQEKSEAEGAQTDGVAITMNTSFDPSKIPQTCFDWKSGFCEFGDKRCKYLHILTDDTSPADPNYILPKHKSVPITCWFWLRDARGCKLSEKECKFAHWNTGLLAKTRGGKQPTPIDRDEKPLYRDTGSRHESIQVAFDGKGLAQTCWFWARGNCRRGSTCSHLHAYTDQPLVAPPGWKERDMAPDAGVVMQSSHAISSPPIQTSLLVPEDVHNSITIAIGLAGLDAQWSQFLEGAILARRHLAVSHCCEPSIWRLLCGNVQHSPVGVVLSQEGSSDILYRYSSFLRTRSMGALVYEEHFTLILFPARQQEWSFLAVPSPAEQAPMDQIMLFHLMRPLQPPVQKEKNPPPRDMDCIFTDTLAIDCKRLFTWTHNHTLQQKVFLMFDPQDQKEELELLISYFHSKEVDIYHPGIPGSWAHYCESGLDRKNNEGVVLISSDFEDYSIMPNFRHCLKHSYNLFRMGLHPSAIEDTLDYSCVRLFPQGQVILITDDVFERQSGQAHNLVRAFHESKWKNQDSQGRNSRLFARPGLASFIRELVEEYDESTSAGDKDLKELLSLYQVVRNLAPPEGEDLAAQLQRADDSTAIISLPDGSLRSHSELWKQNPVEATDKLVNLFAGWALQQATKYRRFIICHTEYIPAWMSQYNHIISVVTSEECLKQFITKSK